MLSLRLVSALSSLAIACAGAETFTDMKALALFSEAGRAYEDAAALARKDALKAQQMFERAAQKYEYIIASGFVHPDVYYNLGNAYFKLGRPGRAILNYRRAQQLRPTDRDIRYNLGIARSMIRDPGVDLAPSPLLQAFFFWYYDFSILFLAKIATACYIALCLCVAIAIFVRRNGTRYTAYTLLFLTTIAAASFAIKLFNHKRNITAVVVVPELPVRAGYSQAEPELFKTFEGAELFVEDYKRLGNGQVWLKVSRDPKHRGWVPRNAVEPVRHNALPGVKGTPGETKQRTRGAPSPADLEEGNT